MWRKWTNPQIFALTFSWIPPFPLWAVERILGEMTILNLTIWSQEGQEPYGIPE